MDATLTGPSERSLTVRVEGFQNESADNDYDANWLTIGISARDGDRAWEASGRALLSWELHELAGWVAARAEDRDAAFFSGFTGLLQFEAADGALTAVFTEELAPPGADKHDGGTISFEPGPDGLRAFAEGLAALAKATQIRSVEPDGYASKLLGGGG